MITALTTNTMSLNNNLLSAMISAGIKPQLDSEPNSLGAMINSSTKPQHNSDWDELPIHSDRSC